MQKLQETQELKELLTALKREGKSDKKIAEQLGCSISTIIRYRQKFGITETLKHAGNSFRGKSHSEESKKRISEIRIKNRIARGVNNPFYGLTKKNSPSWKGGITSRHDLFFGSSIWKNMRKFVLEHDAHTCQLCGSTEKKLHIHHIIPLVMDWDRRLDVTNLVPLCNDCHRRTFDIETAFKNTLEDKIKGTWRYDPMVLKDLEKFLDPR